MQCGIHSGFKKWLPPRLVPPRPHLSLACPSPPSLLLIEAWLGGWRSEKLAKMVASLPPMHNPAQARTLGLPLRCQGPLQRVTLCGGLLGQSLGNTQLPENCGLWRPSIQPTSSLTHPESPSLRALVRGGQADARASGPGLLKGQKTGALQTTPSSRGTERAQAQMWAPGQRNPGVPCHPA